jgi:surface carbohydrate biosynthesis protein (TIGR04326 family)
LRSSRDPDPHLNQTMQTAIIWDCEETPADSADLQILWNAWVAPEGVRCVCIPQLVEDRAESLRRRYLHWIGDFGRRAIAGKSLIEHMEIRPGFSAWWMSHLFEKSILKSPEITQAIKLFALEDCLNEEAIARVILHTRNPRLAECIRRFCVRKSLAFELSGGIPARTKEGWDVPRALAYFFHYVFKRRVFKPAKAADQWKPGGIFFLDYLINIRADPSGGLRFASEYWTSLVDALRAAKCTTNWLHLGFLSTAVSTFRRASEVVAGFNRDGPLHEKHGALDQFLNPRVATRALCDYLKILRRTSALPGLDLSFYPPGSDLDLAPLMKRDWNDSTRGKSAMWNMLCLNLFEEVMRKLPPQKCGVYLQENMGWERAFVYCWKKSGQGKLIGVPHTSVRFWDLRYFPGPENTEGVPDDLLPNVVAASGPWNRQSLLDGGYPAEMISDTEALRYLFLGGKPEQQSATPGGSSRTLLVCGDIFPDANRTLLSWLEEALRAFGREIRVIFKSHPARELDISQYPGIQAETSRRAVRELAAEADCLLTSNITSAAVDACGTGVQIIQVLDGKTLNFSPLRGIDGVTFVRSANELRAALAERTYRARVPAEKLFFLDSTLPRWWALLEIPAPARAA